MFQICRKQQLISSWNTREHLHSQPRALGYQEFGLAKLGRDGCDKSTLGDQPLDKCELREEVM